jgi:hypothetical protein
VVTAADRDPAESVGERPSGQVVVEVGEQREVGAVGSTGGAEQRTWPGEPHLEGQAGVGGDDHQVGWDDPDGVTVSGERRVDRRLCRLAGIAQQVVDVHEVQGPSLQSPPAVAAHWPSRRSLLRPHPVHLPTQGSNPNLPRPPHEPGWGPQGWNTELVDIDGAEVGLPEQAWRREAFDYATSADLLPSVIAFFARTVETTLARGVLRSYREHRERLVALRGRIDLSAQFSRTGVAVPVACRYDNYTADIAENRYLRAAVRRALRVPLVPAQDRRRLMQQLIALDDVADVADAADDLDRITVTRLNAHYEPALRLPGCCLRTSLWSIRGPDDGVVHHRNRGCPAATGISLVLPCAPVTKVPARQVCLHPVARTAPLTVGSARGVEPTAGRGRA